MHYYPIIALELARERSLEAERRARLLRDAGPTPRSLPRRVLGQLAAWAGDVVTGGRRGTDRPAVSGGAAG
jgi:hypothetical protein